MISAVWLKLAGVGFVLAALAAGAFWVHHQGYEAGKQAQMATIVALRATQQENLHAIANLQAANASWASMCKPSADAAVLARGVQTTIDTTRRQIRHMYDTQPKVKAWADERVPAAIAERLRGVPDHTH